MALACGYLGMKNKIRPSPEMKRRRLPVGPRCRAAWARRWTGCGRPDLHEVLGEEFITIYTEIKGLSSGALKVRGVHEW